MIDIHAALAIACICIIACGIIAWKKGHTEGCNATLDYLEAEGFIDLEKEDKE